jgi:drug/metabolite transporter (DMT)-like permease
LRAETGKHRASRPDAVAWLLLAVLVALWGSAFALIDISLDGFPPVTIVGFRLILGAALVIAVSQVRKTPLRIRDLPLGHFLAIALLGNCIPFFLITWGQQQVPSGMAGILMAITPLVVMGMGHFMLPGERAGWMRFLGIALGFTGVWLLLGGEDASAGRGSSSILWRQLAVLAGAICYGLTIIIARRRPEQDPMLSSTVVLGFSALIMVVPAILAMDFQAPVGPGPGPMLALTVLGLLCTGYATVVYFQLIRRAGATFLSLINYLIPVWAVLVGAVALGERLPPVAWLAMLAVLAGVALAGRGRK